MPQVPVNYVAVLVAAIAGMAVGFLWHGPLFGKQWMALMGLSKEKMEAGKKKGMGKTYALAFLGTLLMSFVLAHALIFASAYLKVSGLNAGVQVGFWNWLGFIVPLTLGSVLWEGKSWKLWFLNVTHWLVMLLVMGSILSRWSS